MGGWEGGGSDDDDMAAASGGGGDGGERRGDSASWPRDSDPKSRFYGPTRVNAPPVAIAGGVVQPGTVLSVRRT